MTPSQPDQPSLSEETRRCDAGAPFPGQSSGYSWERGLRCYKAAGHEGPHGFDLYEHVPGYVCEDVNRWTGGPTPREEP